MSDVTTIQVPKELRNVMRDAAARRSKQLSLRKLPLVDYLAYLVQEDLLKP